MFSHCDIVAPVMLLPVWRRPDFSSSIPKYCSMSGRTPGGGNSLLMSGNTSVRVCLQSWRQVAGEIQIMSLIFGWAIRRRINTFSQCDTELDRITCIDIYIAWSKLYYTSGGGGHRHSGPLQQTWRKQQHQPSLRRGNSLVNEGAVAQ